MSAVACALALLTTDVAGNVSVVEGLNDNAVETVDATGDRQRHPALFTGLSISSTLRLTGRDSTSHAISARARGQTYQSLDSVPARAPLATLGASYTGAFSAGKNGSVGLLASYSITSVAAARTGDGNLLLTLDPLSNGTQSSFTTASASYSHSLSARTSLTETASVLVSTTLSADPIDAANGVVLDRRGVDGVIPSFTSSLSRELSPRDTGSLSVRYRLVYSPYSFDIRTVPSTLGPPQRIHQVVPGVGLTHAFSDVVTATSTAGVSVSTPPLFETDRSPDIFPVASEQLVVTGRRWSGRALAGMTYGTASARLGAGPSFNALAALSGSPIEGRAGRALYLVAIAQATHSTVRSATGTVALEAVGAGVELRYGVTKWLGLYTGYDLRATSSVGDTAPPSFRQIVFLGLSGFFSTDQTLPPIESTQSPYAP